MNRYFFSDIKSHKFSHYFQTCLVLTVPVTTTVVLIKSILVMNLDPSFVAKIVRSRATIKFITSNELCCFTHCFRGVFFDHGVVGKAIKGPICTHQFSGGVNMVSELGQGLYYLSHIPSYHAALFL